MDLIEDPFKQVENEYQNVVVSINSYDGHFRVLVIQMEIAYVIQWIIVLMMQIQIR